MNKKINLVYEWIGPRGPMTNNRIPTVIDLLTSAINYHFPSYRSDLFHTPSLYKKISNSNIIPSCSLPTGPFLYELNWSEYHYRDRLQNFNVSNGLLENNVINETVLMRIRNKTAYFLFTVLYEGYLDDIFLDRLGDYFKQKRIPLTQIIYVSNCYNGKEVYADYCQRKNKEPEMNMEYFPVFRIDRCNIQQALKQNLEKKYKPGPRKKTFLCFNRRYNDHRLMLYLFMTKMKMLDCSYYSMDKIQPESNRSFVDNCEHLLMKFPNMGLISEDIVAADKLLPLVLDSADFSRYPMEHTVDAVEHLYNDSLVNIIMETYFFNNIIHLTEKTYKPIAFMQPFIMVGAAGSLQHVKQMGFKTFDEFWSEDYDLEKDDQKRFMMILDIIKSISAWSADIKIDFTYAVKDIIDFNVAHLNNMPNIEINNLVEKYGT